MNGAPAIELDDCANVYGDALTADQQRRHVIHAMARVAAMRSDFKVVREVITLSGIGTPAEQECCIAEWEADHHKRDYSVWPRHGGPRKPRPGGESEEA